MAAGDLRTDTVATDQWTPQKSGSALLAFLTLARRATAVLQLPEVSIPALRHLRRLTAGGVWPSLRQSDRRRSDAWLPPW